MTTNLPFCLVNRDSKQGSFFSTYFLTHPGYVQNYTSPVHSSKHGHRLLIKQPTTNYVRFK